jgi:phosphoglycerate transporter family protein
MDSSVNPEYASMDAPKKKLFSYWQTRTIIGTMIGYAMYYFVRKNLSVAMPAMEEELGIGKPELGIFLTLHGLMYGVSKFANGFIGDRVNARYFMVIGLVICAIINIMFGFAATVLVFGILWVLNGWFQGMGFPPSARLLSHWVPPMQLATKMSWWNASHSIGASLTVVLCGFVVTRWGWEWCFYAPSIVALMGALFLWVVLRDTPSSVGLPEIGVTNKKKEDKKEETAAYKTFINKMVFKNPNIWIISIANFFVYALRYAVLDWGPSILKQWKGMELDKATWIVAGFEVAGIAGMLLAGYVTDRYFKGKAIRTCLFCMVGATIFIAIFWQVQHPSTLLITVLLMFIGFFIYGPQALIGIAAANLATRRAAATAGGFTGLFGYASTVLSGWGMGYLAKHYGWDNTFGILTGLGIVGVFVFLLGWNSRAHGYEAEKN